MTTFYLDQVGGNDANSGTTFANRWKSVNAGATAARIAPGDVIRIMASPDETLVGNATWTNVSKTITLASPVTLNVTDCETAWTGLANVTTTADTTQFKENSKSAKHVIAGAFTTGLVAYFATGTLDLSGYQQISFWIFNTAALASSTLSLRLCSDILGVITVNTITIPPIPSGSIWVPITVDTGAALGSAIQSIALYADLDPGSQTIQLDNIIACKASASADALTLTSLIGKVWNRVWVASTTYATNDIRKPSQPNRNGYRYKVTSGAGAAGSSEPTWPQAIGSTVTDGALTWVCEGIEDTWYGIQSINGVTVKLDNQNNTLGNAGRGYHGATETVATYKREAVTLSSMYSSVNSGTLTDIQDTGTSGNHITFTGGWNRTDMSTQTGETWTSGQNGLMFGFYTNVKTFFTFSNVNFTRCYSAFGVTAGNFLQILNCQGNNSTSPFIYLNNAAITLLGQGVIGNNNGVSGGGSAAVAVNDHSSVTLRASCFSSNLTGSGISSTAGYMVPVSLTDVTLKNNQTYGASLSSPTPPILVGALFGNNGTGALDCSYADATLINCSLPEATEFSAQVAFRDRKIFSHKHDQTVNNHLITTDGGTIISATDQRNTASGISWKFRPTSTNRAILYPLSLSVAKIVCAANTPVTVKIWTRRDNTNINGRLRVATGQLPGISEQSVLCSPSINTWAQSAGLTFTATENGVVEILFEVWDGVGTTNNFWVDDVTLT